MITYKNTLATGIAVLGMAAAGSIAGPYLPGPTFGFTELSTTYDAGSGQYVAQSSMLTSGDVTSYYTLLPLTAEFNADEIGIGNDAFVEFRMNLDNITSSGADGIDGQILIRDINGDTLEGSFSGIWNLVGEFGFFNGQVDYASFNTAAGNGTFESTGVGNSFQVPDLQSYFGAISFLIHMNDWFDTTNGFSDQISSGDGALLTPTPGSVSLLAIGGLAATRRRRS